MTKEMAIGLSFENEPDLSVKGPSRLTKEQEGRPMSLCS
jgi:hypothetical protein